jgi:hypothetical protein
MLHALRSLAVFLFLLAGGVSVAAETKPFAREDMASDAVRLIETLRVATAAIGAQVKGKTPQQLLTEAARAVMGSNFADAEKLAGAAITAAPKDPSNWLAYAGKWSARARLRLMPPISIRRRPTHRPRR